MRDFDTWFSQFRESIATYAFYVDFPKVFELAKEHKVRLHALNALIGSQTIEADFRALVEEYPSILAAIPILLAKREPEIFAEDEEGGGLYSFATRACSLDAYCTFMRKTGLFDLLSKHLVSNLYDYVLGVETGLDSNGRKGRGGKLMEQRVERYLIEAGVNYECQFSSQRMAELGVDIAPLTNAGKTVKRFDFVVKTAQCVYAIETNFYSSNGSKLNETARSYKMLALEAQKIPGFKFVWFTDGAGWKSAENNLRETFEVLPTLFNLKDLEQGIAKRLFV